LKYIKIITSSAHADDCIAAFEKRVEKATASVKSVLNVDRRPHVCLAGGADHDYIDKYKLVDLLVNTTIIALMNAFECLGLTKQMLLDICDTYESNSKAVTLRFECSESRTIVKEYEVDQTLYAKETQESTSGTSEFGIERIVKRALEQHFEVEVDWETSIYLGTDLETRKVIKSWNGTETHIRDSKPNKSSPSTTFPPKKKSHKPAATNPHFAIDVSPENTITQDGISFAHSLMSCARRICLCLQKTI